MKTWKVIFAVSCGLIVAACGGGGGGSTTSSGTSTSTPLTVTGTAATGLAIPGAIVTGKCKVGTGTATTLADGSYTLTITDGQLPCVLQIVNPVDGIKLHTVVFGTGSTANANITPLTEMATARVLGSEPNVFFAAFDAAVATQKITSTTIQAAQTDIGLVLTGTVDTAALGNFISAPLKAATQGSPTTGDAQDKLLDALKLKLGTAQIGTVTTALASNQTTDAIKQTVISLTTAASAPPVANAGTAQSVVTGTTVTLDASTSSAAAGKSLTYAWTLTAKPAGSTATLAAPTTAKPTFVAGVAGSYVASVIVNDGTTASSAAAVTITASVANAAPVANAGVAQNVVAGSLVTLDGSTSSDANGDSLTYVWTLTSKPAGSSAALSSATSPKPTFTADLAGTYVASLTVNDGKVNSNLATTSVTAVQERFQAAASGTIVDSFTGLTWMRCALGQVWTGSTCSGDAATYVQSEIPGLSSGFVYASISNWRVPTVRELQSIVKLSRFNPSTDPTAFPNTPFTHFRTSSGEWTIGFGNSGTTQATPSAFLPVRLVTSTTTLPVALMRLDRPSGDFADNLNGTVTHLVTGLMWQKCMKGQTFDAVANTCTGIAREYLPSQVVNESFAGHTDWRVPTIEECGGLI